MLWCLDESRSTPRLLAGKLFPFTTSARTMAFFEVAETMGYVKPVASSGIGYGRRASAPSNTGVDTQSACS